MKTKLTPSSPKKVVRKAWIEAMESGTYRQAFGVLNKRGKIFETYCALGVLCDLAEKAGVTKKTKTFSSRAYEFKSGSLPQSVRIWAGVSTECGNMKHKGRQTSIVGLNDTSKLSLPEIAEVVKQCPEGLFTDCEEE